MAYKLTPYDRRVQAELIRKEREARYASRYPTYKKTGAATVAPVRDEKEKNGFVTALHTTGDVFANVGIGLGKGVEGIVDLFAGLGGAVAGIFDDDAQKAVKDWISTDWTGELYGNAWQEGLDQSALNGTKAGEIIEGVAQGVGQMLPAVAVSLIPGVGQGVAVGLIAGSAAGTGAEQAFQEGAGYGQGMLYGAASGAVEAGTELLTGGAGKVVKKGANTFLKSSAKSVGKEVAETGLKRVAKEAISEGAEEMISEAANPALKTIYKGKDALKEYSDEEFWGGVLEAGVIGAGTQMAYAGSVGHVTRQSGVYADANSVLEHVGEQGKRIAKGDLSTEQEVQARENIKADFALLEKRLAKTKPAVRKRVLKNPTLAAAFDANGTLKQDFVAQMDADIAAATDTTYDRANRSSTLSAETIDSVVQKANAKGIDVRAFKGTLSEEQSKKNTELRTLMGSIGQKSGGKVKYFLAENVGDHGFFDPDTGVVAIDVSTLESGSAAEQILKGEVATELWRDTAIHETGHATEGTASHIALVDHLASNNSVYTQAVDDFIDRGYFGEDMDAAEQKLKALLEKEKSGAELTESEQKDLDTARSEIAQIATENVLGNADFVKRLIKGEPSRAEQILNKIVQIKNALSGEKGATANKEIAFVRKAERLYLNAIAELGGTYRDGKIHLANREEEKEGEGVDEKEKAPTEGEVKYSYDFLVKKPDMIIKDVTLASSQEAAQYRDDTVKFGADMRKNAAQKNNPKNTETKTYLFCKDLETDVLITKNSFKHGGARLDATYVTICKNVDAVLENSIVVNEMNARDDTDGGYVLLGMVETPDDFVVVRSVVNKRSHRLMEFQQLDAIKKQEITKIEDVGLRPPDYPQKRGSATSSTISIAGLLNFVKNKNLANEVFSADVAQKLGVGRTKGSLSNDLKFSRKSANRNHDKVYTKSDARKVLSDVLREQLVFGNEQAYGALYGKHYTEVVDKLWHVLNDAKPGERGGVALDMADYIIDNAAVESMDFSESAEALERVQILREYLHKLDLSEVSKHLSDKYGKQWRAKKGTDGVSLEKVAAELRAKGVEIKGEGADDLFLGIRDAYNEARSLTVNELKTKLGEVMPPEEREQRRQDIAKEILRGFDNVGEDSKLARETVRMEAERDALKKNYQERMEAEREQTKAEKEAMRERLAKNEECFQEMRRAFREERRKLRERFENWQEREALLDRMDEYSKELDDIEKERFFSATVYTGVNATLKKIPGMLRTALKTKRAFTGSIRNTLMEVKNWYCADDNAMLYKAAKDKNGEGMASGQVVFDEDIAAMLEELTSAKGELTVRELEMVNAVAHHFVKLTERYQRVFINGKWVDAEQLAEEMVKVMQTAQKDQNWIVRGLLNKYMRQFGDPAALFRAMDAYDPNGFYTKMHEWMRNAAISMQSDELHALREYYEWHEKHKKWTKHLENDMVEFRGEQMTLGQLMTLYCNAKTEKSKQALADNGYKFTDKDGGVHRLKGIIYHQKGNSSVKHTREEVQRACKGVENDIWDMLTEEQREYVKLLENVLNTTCRKWKIDTDTLMKGFSRVHERGYYFPTAHNGIAKTVDTTFYEGDRVGHLSLNKDVVEGARGELLIENIDDVVLRHVHNMSLYKNYAIVAENRSMLQNIDVGEVDAVGKRVKNVHQAVTIRTVNEEFGKNRGTDLMKLLDKMSNDLQGGRRAGQDEQSFLKDLVEQIRGNYARFQLGLNPKTLATQLSSLIAAGNILEYNCIVRGVKGFASKKTAQLVDKYCPLAELRNFDNSAALAAGVLETTGKVGDVLMKGIGFVDRRVICSLFYACQLQVQKDSKLELGTEENLKAAGELLTRVILETQQNSLVTEKSDAMRGGIFSRTFTMFTADGMKVIGRWFDSIGEWAVLSKRYKEAKTDADKARLKKELKRAHGQAIRSTSALAAQAAYMALISYLFRLLYDKDEEDAKGNILNAVWDFIGGIVGGLPLLRDMVSYFTEGYELDNFFLSTINDVLVATGDAFGVAKDAISGKDVSRQDVAGAVRKVVYSAGQVLGIPVRNGYNFVTGLTRRIVPTAGYTVDGLFTQKAYASDLEKAIESGDENMIETIAGLMIDEKIGIKDAATRKTLQDLTSKGYKVMPRSVGDSVTVDGETVELTGSQQKKLREVYAIGQDAVADMVKLKQFAEADEKVQAAAIKFIYDVYWDLALEDALGVDLAEKNVLFAEAIDIEKLAVIIAMARSIEADKDKDGKAISGTRKRKLQTFVNSLRLSAAEKYMVMGYLGYTNVNGESDVKAHIGKLNLSKSEKAALLKYSGYGA